MDWNNFYLLLLLSSPSVVSILGIDSNLLVGSLVGMKL